MSAQDRMPARAPKPPRLGRPRGSFGDVAQALDAAAATSPGTVKELAARAQVGYRVAQYTATRLVDAGKLAKLNEGRPAVLGRPAAAGMLPPGAASGWGALQRALWPS